MEIEEVDILILGSGQGAVPLACDLAGDGKRVVVFERERLGGTCVNWGCTPSKAFLGAAHAAGRARLAGALGVVCDVRIDFAKLMGRVRAIRDQFRQGVEQRLRRKGVEIVTAEAAFGSDSTVHANGKRHSAPLTVIDTGSRPALPLVEGLADSPYLTDHTLWELEELPGAHTMIGTKRSSRTLRAFRQGISRATGSQRTPGWQSAGRRANSRISWEPPGRGGRWICPVNRCY